MGLKAASIYSCFIKTKGQGGQGKPEGSDLELITLPGACRETAFLTAFKRRSMLTDTE